MIFIPCLLTIWDVNDASAHQKEKQMQAAIRKIKQQQANERQDFHLTDVPIIQQASAEVQKLSTALPDEEEGVYKLHYLM